MAYFKSNGVIISQINEDNLINAGTNGRVYLLDDNKCIKIYNDECPSRMKKDVFDLLKSYRLNNYYVLYDLIYNEKKENVGYISEYYKKSLNNLLLMPTEYLIENYDKIYKSIVILSNNGILTKDLYYRNAIIGDEQITIIDADSYCFERCDHEVLKNRNLSYLSYLFYGMYKSEAEKLGINLDLDKKSYEKVRETFYLGDLTSKSLSRKLSPYKKGIDLIKR